MRPKTNLLIPTADSIGGGTSNHITPLSFSIIYPSKYVRSHPCVIPRDDLSNNSSFVVVTKQSPTPVCLILRLQCQDCIPRNGLHVAGLRIYSTSCSTNKLQNFIRRERLRGWGLSTNCCPNKEQECNEPHQPTSIHALNFQQCTKMTPSNCLYVIP